MVHFAQSLGVNCTYCHNTRAFGNWATSSPARVTAWYGIRMVRDVNNNYLELAARRVPRLSEGTAGRQRKGQLRHLPPGLVQAALRRQHAEDVPRAGRARYADYRGDRAHTGCTPGTECRTARPTRFSGAARRAGQGPNTTDVIKKMARPPSVEGHFRYTITGLVRPDRFQPERCCSSRNQGALGA